MKKIIFSIILLNFLNCNTLTTTDPATKTKELEEILNARMAEDYDTTRSTRIFFGTNRKQTGEKPACSDQYFSVKHDDTVKYGFCDVSVPYLHDIGNLDFSPEDGKDKSFLFQSHLFNFTESQWLEQVKADPNDEIIVFVHGFNVKFEEAVLRAAQIKYDLKFRGNVVLYTWPAGAEEGFLNSILMNETYKDNFKNAEGSRNHFVKFMDSLINTDKKIHLIVHSMGHQVVLPSLDKIYKDRNKSFLRELILNAPDFESVQFAYISHNLMKASKRITVYCSPGDNALVASSKVNKNKRVGSCEKISGIDMINVNPIDAPFLGVGGLGHGYYSSRPVLTDLFQVILGIDARKRLFIRKSQERDEDFVLRR